MPIIYARAGSLKHVSSEEMQKLTEGGKYEWINPYTKLKEGKSWLHPLVQCKSCQEHFRIVSCECGHTWIEAVVPRGGKFLYVRHPGYRQAGIPPHLINRWRCINCGTENTIGTDGTDVWVLEKKRLFYRYSSLWFADGKGS